MNNAFKLSLKDGGLERELNKTQQLKAHVFLAKVVRSQISDKRVSRWAGNYLGLMNESLACMSVLVPSRPSNGFDLMSGMTEHIQIKKTDESWQGALVNACPLDHFQHFVFKLKLVSIYPTDVTLALVDPYSHNWSFHPLICIYNRSNKPLNKHP